MGLEEDDCCGCCGSDNCGKRCVVGPAQRGGWFPRPGRGHPVAHPPPVSPPQMLSSVLAAVIGIAGSGYCVIVAALGLAAGPLCLDSSNQWNYTFLDTEGQ